MSRATFAFIVFMVAAVAVLSFTADHWHSRYTGAEKARKEAVALADVRQQTIDDMTQRQRDVASLDAKYTKELANAKAENDALQRRLSDGGRVHVKGRCTVPASTETASPGSVGNAATIELPPVAGQNVLGIRSGIISDQAKLKYLQDYIRTQCR